MEIFENVPLGPLTTLGVGGNARFLAKASNPSEVDEAVAFSRSRNLKLFVLGGGSNIVVADRGWDGLVLQVAITGINQQAEKFHVGAGENWDDFVDHVVALNYAGVECLSGIPGTVGGTPIQNVGAYGQEVSETITSVQVFDLAQNRIQDLSRYDCRFSYRTSIFNTSERGRYVVLRVSYSLIPGGWPQLQYADLQKHFAGHEGMPTASAVRDAVMKIRASKGMLITPGDPESHSAGSFFKNPVLSAAQHDHLIERARERNLQVPSYPALEQQHKVSAAWLVEHSGFKKGYQRGNAAISSKHALAIINRGGATAAEIVGLKNEVQDQVEQTWGIRLEPEPAFVGF